LAIIDCHALVVSTDTARYPIAEDGPPPAPQDWAGCTSAEALMEALGAGVVSGAVLVQRNRFYGFDNGLICDLAAASPALRAICSVDARRDEAATDARDWIARRGASGIRFMEPSRGSDPSWIDSAAARGVWRVAADEGAIVDVHAFPWNRAMVLPVVRAMARKFPGLPILLDNLGNPSLQDGAPDFGLDAALAALADCPALTLKFSAMTLARLARTGLDPAAAMARFARAFGPDRLIWGSDLLGEDETLRDAATRAMRATDALGSAAQDAMLHGNAVRLFGFD